MPFRCGNSGILYAPSERGPARTEHLQAVLCSLMPLVLASFPFELASLHTTLLPRITSQIENILLSGSAFRRTLPKKAFQWKQRAFWWKHLEACAFSFFFLFFFALGVQLTKAAVRLNKWTALLPEVLSSGACRLPSEVVWENELPDFRILLGSAWPESGVSQTSPANLQKS